MTASSSPPTPSPVWHPFTQHALQAEVPEIVSAEDATLVTRDGRRILDAISSWWVITHGHRHPKIMDAVKRQADELDHVIFAGFTHRPAERLAERLVDMAPAGLTHVFYSDSGSTAVEVAIKMALGFWHNQGIARHKIVCLEHGYHGDTVGTMSAGARGVFNAAYQPLLYDVEHLPFPDAGAEAQTIRACEVACQKGDVAAVLVEPLILGAGGMKMYSADTLRKLQDVCAASNVLLIADEVMTGWGRTGTRFAVAQAGITPDILCLAKGLTGGSIPLAVTLTREEIFAAHYSTDRSKTFFHSSSFTANPMCCAAALANCEIWQDEPVGERISDLCALQTTYLKRLEEQSLLTNLRQCGTITAMEFADGTSNYLADIGPRLYQHFLSRDVLLRPLGNTIYVMPPYCTTRAELERVYEAIATACDEVSVS